MAKIEDKVDLYDDRGNVLLSDVPLTALSPLRNSATRKIINLVVRMGAVNLAGLEANLKAGAIGGKGFLIRRVGLDLPLVEKGEELRKEIEDILRVEEGDDTDVKLIAGGKRMLIGVPMARIMADYSAGLTAASAALTQAIIDVFDVSIWDAVYVKTAVWGGYPENPDPGDGAVKFLVDIPIKNEGMGYALRNIPVNHLASTVRKRAIPGACLTMILEEAAMYEMGDAIGPFERGHLLDFAYEGMNAGNIVYDLIKENGGKEGTLAGVVYSLVERAKADGIIKPKKTMPSGYTVYTADDLQLWNAYASAGMLAAVCVNCGAMRAGQAVPSNCMYYNDLLEHETGLVGVDYGRAQGSSVSGSFFSHSIYGGGGPGVFHGNHIVTRHAKGQFIPCICAAMCIDADTQYFTPTRTSGLYGEVLGVIPEFAEPMKAVAEGAKELM